MVGYVRQDDFLLPYLTVRETLRFAAALRLPAQVDQQLINAIVEDTISELGLKAAADSTSRRGISGLSGMSIIDIIREHAADQRERGNKGGERRRLSIGCVLVTLPSVLILDEPTTGLDSFSAFQLLETLSQLAKKGRSIILSIHQPRSDAFALFDKVTLLSAGSVIYSGETSAILDHFAQEGFVPPKLTNPLDFVIDVSSIDTRTDESEASTKERVGKLVLAWKESENSKGVGTISGKFDEGKNKRSTDLEKANDGPVEEDRPDRRGELSNDRASMLSQTKLLTSRAFRNVFRNYGQNVGFLLQAVM